MAAIDTQDQTDPEADLRRRVMGQVSNDPVYGDPTINAQDTGAGARGAGAPTPVKPDQGITDPAFNASGPTTNVAPAAPANSASAYPTAGGTAPLSTAVAQLYRTALRREASDAEIQSQIQGGSGDLATIQQSIYNSPEAAAYNARRQSTTASPTATGNAQDLIRQYQSSHPASGGAGLDDMIAFLKANGVNAKRYVDPTYGPSNNELDLGQGKYKVYSEGANSWYTGGDDGGGQASAGPAQLMPAPVSPFTAQIRDMLMKRMAGDTAPVNENDANIAEPFNAANLTAQRAQEGERKALAEHLYASSGGADTSDAMRQGIQQSAERNATGLASLKGQLIQKEYAARRSDLADAMQQALASGDRETAYQLQMALSQLDAQIRREGLGVNMAEFGQQQNNIASNFAAGA